eukprot:TRINITY_DN9708_c0_g4_i1.p1 TRINITY_DN9708_c0_g4~~TRINITY_DN9708_c0_g4_i1.p1  ORF type:complete len:413 (+),score=90.06 TRINITY_DN9708_c0_g4_i1:19-1257(+)
MLLACSQSPPAFEGVMQDLLGQPGGEGSKVLLQTPKKARCAAVPQPRQAIFSAWGKMPAEGCQASGSGAREKIEVFRKLAETPKVPTPAPTSHLARFLEAQGQAPGDDTEALEAAMAPCIDSMLKAQHLASERSRPSSDRVVAALSSKHRAQLIAWIMQVFSILGLDDALVHSVALTIDRFCACQDRAVPNSMLECLMLSAACTEFKTDGFSDQPEFTWKRILEHMSQGRVPMLRILHFELHLLTRLQYVVGLPTPLTFVRSLATRMRGEEQVTQWLGLATFLLDLALLDLDLQHAYAHAYLAAGALMATLRVFSAPVRHREALLEDVDACWPAGGPETSDEIVATCEEELLQLWIRGQEGMIEHGCYPMLEAKFRCQSKIQVSLLTPDEALTALREERESVDMKGVVLNFC